MRYATIYGLFDPRRPNVVMTVGKTVLTLENRLSYYLRPSGVLGSRTKKWINKLISEGIFPGIKQLARVKFQNWKTAEKKFITIWRKRNPVLNNILNGGDGTGVKESKLFCEKHKVRRVLLSGDTSKRCSLCRKEKHGPYRKQWYKRNKVVVLTEQNKQRRLRVSFGLCRWSGCSTLPESGKVFCTKHKKQNNRS